MERFFDFVVYCFTWELLMWVQIVVYYSFKGENVYVWFKDMQSVPRSKHTASQL